MWCVWGGDWKLETIAQPPKGKQETRKFTLVVLLFKQKLVLLSVKGERVKVCM